MKSKLQVVEVLEAEQASVALPEHVQLSLAGIAGQANEGLLALTVRTSLAVQHKTLGREAERIAGPKASPTGAGSRSDTATPRGRSRSVAAGTRSAARVSAPRATARGSR